MYESLSQRKPNLAQSLLSLLHVLTLQNSKFYSTLINIICIIIEHSQLFPRDNVHHIVLFNSSQINSSSPRLNPSPPCPFNPFTFCPLFIFLMTLLSSAPTDNCGCRRNSIPAALNYFSLI